MTARLIVEGGSANPQILELREDAPATLGRRRSASVFLQDRHASREHAEVAFDGGSWVLHYAETTNGTRLDGRLLEGDARLRDNQVIAIGDVRLRFRSGPDDGTPPPAPEPDETTLFEPDEVTALLRFTSTALAEDTPHGLIGRALDTLLRQTLADVGGYLSLDPEHPESRVVRPLQASLDVPLSQQLTAAVLRTGRRVWLASDDGRLLESESLVRFDDAVCVLLGGGPPDAAPLGALHLYARGRTFTDRQVRFTEAVASSLAAALQVLRGRLALQADNERLREHASAANDAIVGSSAGMARVREQVRNLADGPCTVLIIGESGVGKELVAIGLHQQSSRHKGPMVTVNCAAIATGLAESELFGHVRGAFNNAYHDHPGYFAQADTGTLFLDEIGELSQEMQAKLLRVIEGHPFRPVGAKAERRADVRIVAATNRDLAHEVREGRFRQDLFYRLTVRVTVPPLREHPEDVPELVRYFLGHLEREYRRSVRLSDAALERLRASRWPGNVRQLRSVLEAAVANAGSRTTIHAGDLSLVDVEPADAEREVPGLNLEALEQWAIRQALARSGRNKTKAAVLLGIHRETLGLKMKAYGLGEEK